MPYYQQYRDLFDAVKTRLETISGLTVVLGGPLRLDLAMPCAIIMPMETAITQAAQGAVLQNRITFDVVVIVRSTEPDDWFAEVIEQMGPILDALMVDRTLGRKCSGIWPTSFTPGEVRLRSNLYYGGLVSFQALVFT